MPGWQIVARAGIDAERAVSMKTIVPDKTNEQAVDQSTSEAIEKVKEAASRAIDGARQSINEALDRAKQRVGSALETAQECARQGHRRCQDSRQGQRRY
jgi:prefoldin subunit 5